MKVSNKQIATERIDILMDLAISKVKESPELSENYAQMARKLGMHYKTSLPYVTKICFCKKCKSFIAPGINSKIRIRQTKPKAIGITCSFCGHTYRKIIAQ